MGFRTHNIRYNYHTIRTMITTSLFFLSYTFCTYMYMMSLKHSKYHFSSVCECFFCLYFIIAVYYNFDRIIGTLSLNKGRRISFLVQIAGQRSNEDHSYCHISISLAKTKNHLFFSIYFLIWKVQFIHLLNKTLRILYDPIHHKFKQWTCVYC